MSAIAEPKSDSGILVHPTPLHHFKPTDPSAAHVNVSQVYIDEANDDLVVISDHQVLFSRLAVIDDTLQGATNSRLLSPQSAATSAMSSPQGPSPLDSTRSVSQIIDPVASPKTSQFADVLQLRTSQRTILAAKRCVTRTSQTSHFGVVAVCHNTGQGVSFYNVPSNADPASGEKTKKSFNKATPLAPDALLEPFATYSCQPNNLRFGSDVYPITSFNWVPLPLELNRSKTKVRAIGKGVQFMVVASPICIELVSVFPLETNQQRAIMSLKRITTRTNYLSFDRVSNCFISINSSKARNIKCFGVYVRSTGSSPPVGALYVDPAATTTLGALSSSHTSSMESTVHVSVERLTQFELDATDAKNVAVDPRLGQRQMLPPSHNVYIRIVTVYGDRYVAVVTKCGEVVLYKLILRNQLSESQAETEGSYEAVRTHVLQLHDGSSPLALFVLDNLIVAHSVSSRLSFVYDLRCVQGAAEAKDVMRRLSAEAATLGLEGRNSPTSPRGPSSPSQPNGTSNVSQNPQKQGLFSRLKDSFVASAAATPVGGATELNPDLVVPLVEENSPLANAVRTGEYYNASSPVILDRTTGRVFLLGLSTSKAIETLRNRSTPSIFRFCVNRSGPSSTWEALQILQRVLYEQASLKEVSQLLESLTLYGRGSQHTLFSPFVLSHAAIAIEKEQPMLDVTLRGDVTPQKAISSNDPVVYYHHAVGPDALFHIRRAVPPQSRTVQAHNLEKLNQFLPQFVDEEPAPHLHLEDAFRREHHDAAALLAGDPSSSSRKSASQTYQTWLGVQSNSHPTPKEMLRIPQYVILRYVFKPLFQRFLALSNQEDVKSATAEPEERSSSSPCLIPHSDADKLRVASFIRYLRSVVLEFVRAIGVHRNLAIHPDLQQFVVNLCITPPHADFYVLHQMILYRVLQDSIPLGLKLVSLERDYPPALQAGLDMLGRLQAFDTIATVLLQRKMVLRALHVVLAHDVPSVSAIALLEQAAALDDAAEAAYKRRRASDGTEAISKVRPPTRSIFAVTYASLRDAGKINPGTHSPMQSLKTDGASGDSRMKEFSERFQRLAAGALALS